MPNEFLGGAARILGFKPDEGLYWGNAILGIVCIAPVFVAIIRAPSFKVAAWLGVVFGGVSTALSSFWLIFFQGFTVWTYGGTILGYCGYNALLFPFLRGLSRLSPRLRPFLVAVGWSVYEYFKSIGFLGYPWGLVAYPVGNVLPLIQFVDITGVWGLSLLMSLVNAVDRGARPFGMAPAAPKAGSVRRCSRRGSIPLWRGKGGISDPIGLHGQHPHGPTERRPVGWRKREGRREQHGRQPEHDCRRGELAAEKAGPGGVE